MSPSPGEDAPPPRTPTRKSSASTIFRAFQTLTSGRPKSSSPATTLPTTSSPIQGFFATKDIKREALAQRSFSENGSASTVSQAVSDDAGSTSAQAALSVLGGPPELGMLLLQLDKMRPMPERITAAYKISPILDAYKISNPLAIWAAGEDLLSSLLDDASRAGHTLLVSCARTNELAGIERKVLFDSLATLFDGRYLHLRLQALIALTNNGRNVESIEQDILSYCTRLLSKGHKNVNLERRNKKSRDALEQSSDEETFDGLFKFIIEVTKFNAKVFDEADLKLLLQCVLELCRNTTATDDLASSTNLVIALLTFTQVPATSIKPCLEFLADVYCQIPELKKDTWNALTMIFKSHLGQQAVTTYLDLIENYPTTRQKMTAQGAFRVIAHLLEKNCKNGLPEVPLTLLLPILEKGLTSRDAYLAEDVLCHFKELLFEDDLRALLQQEPDWELFVLCTIKSADIMSLDAFRPPPDPPEIPDGQSISSASTERSKSGKKKKKGREPPNVPKATRNLHELTLKLVSTLPDLDLLHKDAVIGLLRQLGPRLSNAAAEILITCCEEERLVLPSSSNWEDTSKSLINNYVHDHERPTELRCLAIRLIQDAYPMVDVVSEDIASELAMLLLKRMDEETDGIVLDALAGFAVSVVERAGTGLFEAILSIFRVTVFQRRPTVAISANLSPLGGLPLGLPAQTQPSLCRTAAKHVVRMFIAHITKSAHKAEALYDFILKVAGCPDCAIDARICALKLLFRLRATSGYAIYIRPVSESERIAAVLCRTADTANWSQHTDPAATVRENRIVSSSSARDSLAKHKSFDVRRPVPPLWFYPGPKGLPEDPSRDPSMFVYSYQDPETQPPREGTAVLKMAFWLETIISLLQQPETDWEIYSYVIVHLGAQLANQNLFRGSIPQVKFIRSVVCEQIRTASFHEPPSYTSLKKTAVAVCLFHILTMLVGYHDHFSRNEEDEIVRAFILGIGSWDRTSKWCIHALSVCCYELPLSVSKALDSIIHKMSQIITQSQIAIHILEFLVMLARLPDLYKNFREDEYKMVFGVSIRYLQDVREKREKEKQRLERERDGERNPIPSRPSKLVMRGSINNLRPLDETNWKPKNLEDLPQYVYALAFHVITFWFMGLRLQDRPVYMAWISRSLTYVADDGREIIEDQGLVTMDMMEKVAYSDRDETARDPNFAKETDGEVAERTWIIGYSMLTIETAGRTGLSQITKRRPSGTKYSIFKPSLTSPPRHQVPLTTGLEADAFYTSSYIGLLPEDIIQEFYSSYNLLDTKAPRPIPLPEDEAVARAITSFDFNPTVDGHKVGVIYVGEGQESEAEILANTHGSADYTTFIGNLGFLTRLKNAQFNTAGLDRSEDTDGKYAYCWRDRATEIVFHVTTMMPTHLDFDPQSTHKKSHIGNDFVNVIWNDSGGEFKFNTFPSAFNYIYIVVTPESAQSFTSIRDADHPPNCYYKVQVLSAPGFPEISSAAETKVVSASALPVFIRLLALNASVFSYVWRDREGGEHTSPWRNRLREIKELRRKYAGHELGRTVYAGGSPVGGGKVLPPTTSEKMASEAGGALISPPVGWERGGSALSGRGSAGPWEGSEDLSRSSLTASSLGDRGGVHDNDH